MLVEAPQAGAGKAERKGHTRDLFGVTLAFLSPASTNRTAVQAGARRGRPVARLMGLRGSRSKHTSSYQG